MLAMFTWGAVVVTAYAAADCEWSQGRTHMTKSIALWAVTAALISWWSLAALHPSSAPLAPVQAQFAWIFLHVDLIITAGVLLVWGVYRVGQVMRDGRWGLGVMFLFAILLVSLLGWFAWARALVDVQPWWR